MNHRQNHQHPACLPRQWKRAIQSLEDALHRNTEHPQHRENPVASADHVCHVDELETYGEVQLPQ